MTSEPRIFHSINPATGEIFARIEGHGDAELDLRLTRAAVAAHAWRRVPVAARAAVLLRLATLIEERAEALARTMVAEMGKPVVQARTEAAKCAAACRFYGEHAPSFLKDEPVSVPRGQARVRLLPLGVVLAVMPWNFPFWQVVRFLAPMLAAGNVGLLKHAANVPQCALALEALVAEAGAPWGVFQALLIGSDRVERVIADPRVAAVTITGSEAAGVAVATAAGRALKPAVLELGGSDPLIVMPSADLDAAVRAAIAARMMNNGQSCICAKRFIVHDAVYDEFTRLLLSGFAALRIGDPMDQATELGPLCSRSARVDLHAQVQAAVAQGAQVLAGGTLPAGAGFYYPPTLLAALPDGAPIRQQELFGPVAMLFRVRDFDAAIAIANETPFGLGSALWSRDAAEIARFEDEVESGCAAVNSLVASDPRLPFGGVKHSGYGRELAKLGLQQFMNVKSIVTE